jgi:hypothetical protein
MTTSLVIDHKTGGRRVCLLQFKQLPGDKENTNKGSEQ